MANSPYSRKWKVHVIQSVHGMLGWARSFDEAQAYFDVELRNNLDLMDQTDHYRKEEQHRFVVDCTWIVSEYLKRWPADAERVRQRIREGRLEISAYEASVLDMCLSGEELIRCFYDPADLERHGYGYCDMAVYTDIHAFSFGLPSLAAGSGIKYVMVGTNTDSRCGFLRYPPLDVIPRGHALFWWQGIAGQRVLCFHYGSYHEASRDWGGGEFDPALVDAYLQHFEDMGEAYPYDAVVMFGTGGDAISNGGFHHSLIGTNRIRDWNREHDAYDLKNLNAPLLINGRLRDFFVDMEARFGSRIPVYAGGWGGGDFLWDTQNQRFAKTGLQSRQSSARIRMAETLSAASKALLDASYPSDKIKQVFKYRIWHDEHDTNGTRPRVTQEVKEGWRALQQRWGSQQMERPSVETLQKSLQTFAAGVPTGSGTQLLVFNPLSHARSDVVRWPCNALDIGQVREVIDEASGTLLPSQYVIENGVGNLLFIARNVPSLGYAIYTLNESAAQSATTAAESPSGQSIENEFYRVTCDPSGAVSSIWDKKAGREIVRAGSHFNVYVNNGSTPRSGTAYVENIGPVASNLRIEVSSLPLNTQSLCSRIWLYAGLDRIDIVNEFAVANAEQEIYYDFPLNLEGPLSFTLEGPSSTILIAGENEFDEATNTHWNTFSFVDASTPDYGVTLFSPEVRQAYLGGQVNGTEPAQSNLSNPALLMRVMGHGPLEQDWLDFNGGDSDNPYRYFFSLSTHEGALDVSHATRQGWAALFPLQVCPVAANQPGVLSAPQASFWHVPDPLLVMAFKKAEAGTDNEYILRLWNPMPTPVQAASVFSDLFAIVRARQNDHIERDSGPDLPLEAGSMTVDAAPKAVITVRVWLVPRMSKN